jgi:hypothetical protein
MTDEELFDKTREYNVKLREYTWRRQVHTNLGADFPEGDLLLELETLLHQIGEELHRRREKAKAEHA